MNAICYFKLRDDMAIPERWALYQKDLDEQGHRVEPWQFTRGQAVQLDEPTVIGISHPGLPLDFSLTELATPVVTEKFVAVFKQLELGNEVQFLPARVDRQTDPYFILNVLQVIRCIDDARCEEVRYWTPEDGLPDKVGKYCNVSGLKVDPTKLGTTQIARPWGWTSAIIVTERIKLAMEHAGLTGTHFSPA